MTGDISGLKKIVISNELYLDLDELLKSNYNLTIPHNPNLAFVPFFPLNHAVE